MRTPRYGERIRKLYDAANASKRSRYTCPKCGKENVKRTSYAIWECKSCRARIAGGAYSLTTKVGEVSNMLIKEHASD